MVTNDTVSIVDLQTPTRVLVVSRTPLAASVTYRLLACEQTGTQSHKPIRRLKSRQRTWTTYAPFKQSLAAFTVQERQ